MIEISGDEGSSEHEVAKFIGSQLAALWPGLLSSSRERESVKIISNVKISGYAVADLDVVVMAAFPGGERRFVPVRPVDRRANAGGAGHPISVRNFIAVVEVKDQDSDGVRFDGNSVSVRYSNRRGVEWKNATDQNVRQALALRDYLRDIGRSDSPFIFRCIVLRGVSNVELPGAIGFPFTAKQLLTSIAEVNGLSIGPRGLFLSSWSDTAIKSALQSRLFRRVLPTALDRRKMDAIVAGSRYAEEVFQAMGHQLVWLRGRSGTGKTLMLLHAATRAYQERADRSLVLTYNHALAADIRRMLYLLRLPSGTEEGGVKVQTVMSFVTAFLREVGLLSYDRSDDRFLEVDYLADCRIAVESIRAGAITTADIQRVFNLDPETFRFENIIIDEGQDWPQDEADLIKLIYGARRIALADGVDQLTRTRASTDWRRGVSSGELNIISLKECIRMKRNLAIFSSFVAKTVFQDWGIVENSSAGGGRVIVAKESRLLDQNVNERLLREAREKGNAAIDILHCVPTGDIVEMDGRRISALGRRLVRGNCEVWDGVDEIRRRDFPRSSEEVRVVHYASCRGLEGWAVVLHELDEFWNECYSFRKKEELDHRQIDAEDGVEEVAAAYAWRRVAIALSRPIDTLVISLKNPDSVVGNAIISATLACRDFCEVIG